MHEKRSTSVLDKKLVHQFDLLFFGIYLSTKQLKQILETFKHNVEFIIKILTDKPSNHTVLEFKIRKRRGKGLLLEFKSHSVGPLSYLLVSFWSHKLLTLHFGP